MANYSNNLGQIRLGWRTAPVFTPDDPGTPNTIDPDSTNFILASGISDSLQISAIETLVADLKAYGLWTKMKAIYPFVGGSAASHKFNLKDPRNLDAAYRLVFNGGWTHTGTGAQPNGTTGYANTYYNPSSLLNPFIGYYSRSNTNTNTDQIDMGCFGSDNGDKWFWVSAWYKTTTYNNIFARNSSSNVLLDGGIQSDSRGWYWTNKISNVAKLGRNSNILTTANDTQTPPNASIGIGAMGNSNTSANYFSNRETVFSVIADGLTDTETSNLYIVIQKFQTTLGRHVGTPYVSDPDAISFLMAAGITDGTQAAAINTLVIRMKADGVWTKMKAIYPFVGGSATSHKFNLKDPRDLDAAYRLVFNGGWVHSSTGALPNGTTGYADTKLIPSSVLSTSSTHVSVYSRTNATGNYADMGAIQGIGTSYLQLLTKWSDNIFYGQMYDANFSDNTVVDSLGLFVGNRQSATGLKLIKNSTVITSKTSNVISSITSPLYLGARNNNNVNAQNYSSREQAFASIGDGLSDTEATAFYNSVQAYQTTLGRQVNVPLVSDTDAQSFLNAANITSFQQASAVNKLVIDLKAAGVWSKMKAIYPFVGGSADSHKFNLKDPRDLDLAYRLVFNGGWTHTSTGALPNGTTGYADTKLSPSSTLTNYSSHLSFYSRTNRGSGRQSASIGSYLTPNEISLRFNFLASGGLNNSSMSAQYDGYGLDFATYTTSTTNYFLIGNRTANNINKVYENGVLKSTNTTTTTKVLPSARVLIGALSDGNTNVIWYDNLESAFATIGDGLTDAEATSLYTAVQTYQTSLGRSVNTPVYNNGLVLNLDAGNANSYPGTGTTWFDLAAGNNGTLVNGPTYDTTNGGSLYFDGTNKYTDISYTKINITNKLTISSWVYFLSQPSTTGNPNIVDKWDWPNNKRSFHIGTENGYLATSISYDGLFDNRIVCSDNSSIVLNQWINITMTYDGRTLKLYKNGSLIQSSSFSQDRNIFSDITTNIFLGRSRGTEGSSRHLNARISGVQIYSNSLTATEILNNFNSTRGRFGL